MRRTLGWILFFVGVIVLGWWASKHQAPEIQAQITDEANQLTTTLNADPSMDISASVSGRDITLTGTLPEADADQVLDQYEQLEGRRVVRSEWTTLSTQSPYTMQVTKREDSNFEVDGFVPNPEVQSELNGYFGDAASSSFSLASGAPNDWVTAVETGTSALDDLDYGEMKIEDQSIMINGYASSSEALENVNSVLAGLPEGYSVDTSGVETPVVGSDFTVDFDITKGIMIAGTTTSDSSDQKIADALGAPIVSSSLTNDNEGDATAVDARLSNIGTYLPLFDTAQIDVEGDQVNFTGEAVSGAMPDEARQSFLAGFSESDRVQITESTPAEQATRINSITGMTEYYTNGYWLPNMDFEVSSANCQSKTAEVMNGQNINFVTGSAQIDGSSLTMINSLAGLMNRCLDDGSLGLEIGGHTDSDGDETANMELSQARADAVKAAIAARGVNVTSVVSRGFGESDPIASNDTEEGKKANRRTTFTWADLAALQAAEEAAAAEALAAEQAAEEALAAQQAEAEALAAQQAAEDAAAIEAAAEEAAIAEAAAAAAAEQSLLDEENLLVIDGENEPETEADVASIDEETESESLVEAVVVPSQECADELTEYMEDKTIYFVTGSADLKEESLEVLDGLAPIVQNCLAVGNMSLVVGGHTDADGEEQANLELSEERALAVLVGLSERGVDAELVEAVGFGETQPISANDTDEGKAENRRTTFTWQEIN